MSDEMKSLLGMIVTGIACLMLLYFLYSLVWFASVGWRKERLQQNIFTGVGFGAVSAAVGLWFVARASFESSMYDLEQIVLVTSIGLCVSAIVMARFGIKRTAVPTIVGALIVALNAIGTLYVQ